MIIARVQCGEYGRVGSRRIGSEPPHERRNAERGEQDCDNPNVSIRCAARCNTPFYFCHIKNFTLNLGIEIHAEPLLKGLFHFKQRGRRQRKEIRVEHLELVEQQQQPHSNQQNPTDDFEIMQIAIRAA